MWLKWKRCALILGKRPSVVSPVLMDHQVVELVQQYKRRGAAMSFGFRVDAVCKKKQHITMCMCTYITSFAVLMSKPLLWQCFILVLLCLTFCFCGLQVIVKVCSKKKKALRDLSEVRSLKAAWSILADPRPPSLAAWVCVVLPSGHRSKLPPCRKTGSEGHLFLLLSGL